VLRIHVSSEEDPYFLHTLEVTEDEFQSLKAEQGILVDFASFPGKIISLLERCIASQAADMPRFQAVLAVRAADSGLKIVETNDFKQLPHITLAFRPGNDFTVKQVCNQPQATAVQQCSQRQPQPQQMCSFDSHQVLAMDAC
jgi:spindle assembly abnormal protein 6